MLQPRRCVVFGGGGVAGIAWEIGVVAGLLRAGVALQDADGFVGTSAGAVTGAQIACGCDIEALLAQQLDPPADSPEKFRPYSQAAADEQNRALVAKVGHDLVKARQRIGAFALRSATPTLAERRAIVAARLPSHDWPDRRLCIVAVDVHSGERQVFDAQSGVGLVDAVAASCAVPGTWPPVPIGDRIFMDGGIWSLTNADVALGARQIVVLAPLGLGEGNPVSGHLVAEAQALRADGARVEVVLPDRASLDALGDNVLDPARRTSSARAGLAQGLSAAGSLAEWWSAGVLP